MIGINLTPKQNGSTVVRVIIMDGNIFNLFFSWVSATNSGQRSQIQAMHKVWGKKLSGVEWSGAELSHGVKSL